MRYKIECLFSNTFFLYSKEDLFDFFDNVLKYNRFDDAFNYSFEKNFISGYFVESFGFKYEKRGTDENPYYYEKEIREYSNSIYIIKDENNFVVDYDKIYSEYIQSRNLFKKKKSNNYDLNRGTSKRRRTLKSFRRKDYAHSYKRLYSLSVYDKELKVKVRDKPQSIMRNKLIFDYDYMFYEKNRPTSWKNKKIKKQWMKNI